jgi:hypothetical protein
MFSLNTIGSTAASEVSVNPFTATAKVTFANLYGPYTYKNVSRRAIIKAVANEIFKGGQPSVGEWVNTTLHV